MFKKQNSWFVLAIVGLSFKPLAKHILLETTNERGLISVVYEENGEQYACDYLTAAEYAEIFE